MIIFLTGTTGSGKTTLGQELARQLGWRFVEADDYHPQANIMKMSRGEHLTDADREPWLDNLRSVIDAIIAGHEDAVVVAAALTDQHRARLRADDQAVQMVYLKGDPALIRKRVRRRKGHFAREAILDDQFARVEAPKDADAVVDIAQTPREVVRDIRQKLNV